MKNYLIEIRGKNNRKLYRHRQYFYTEGFLFRKKGYRTSYYEKEIDSEEEINTYKIYCKKHRLKMEVHKKEYIRNTTYRKTFMDGVDRKYIFCAYCGMPWKKEKITVDHIIPVDKAKNTHSAKLVMKMLKIQDVNEPKNLCGACKRCNNKKRAKMGIWLFLGFLGKNQKLWCLRWVIRIAIIITASVCLLI